MGAKNDAIDKDTKLQMIDGIGVDTSYFATETTGNER